ncbi:MAG: hypothetical protein GY822_28455 [Deltaproteobacteria bacterium]|nr:hypothetical protein [Deltaproteobacteria bacterium]
MAALIPNNPPPLPPSDRRPSFWRRHATGLTVMLFLVVSGVLSVAPVPAFLKPVDLTTPEERFAAWDRVTKPPRMTLASMEQSDEQAEQALLAEIGEGDAGVALIAESSSSTDAGIDVRNEAHLTSTLPPSEHSQPSSTSIKRGLKTASKKTKLLRRLARLLKAPGAGVENPCTKTGAEGCERTALDPFFASLDAVDRGEEGSHVNVVTLGNSLIASDHVTDIVRERLVSRFGDGGRGFLLPDRLAKTAGRRVRTGRGTPGWEIHTFAQKRPTRKAFSFAGSTHESSKKGDRIRWQVRGATQARIFWLDHPKNPGFVVEADGKKVFSAKGGQLPNDALMGDGTVGVDHIDDFEVPLGTKHLVLKTKGAGVVLYGIALTKDAPGLSFDTIGVPASDAAMYLSTDKALFQRHLASREPNLMVMMLGGNETRSLSYKWLTADEVRQNFSELVDRVQEAVPDAACLVVSPIDAAKATAAGANLKTRPQVRRVVKIEKEVAASKGCAYFNLFAAMGGTGSLQRFHRKGMVNEDLVHPKGKGGDVLGNLLADALLKSWVDTPPPKDRIKTKKRLVRPQLVGLDLNEPEHQERLRPTLSEFLERLGGLGKRKSRRIAIGAFGASHVASQFFADRLRSQLGTRYGVPGRGYVPAGGRAAEYLSSHVRRRLRGPTEVVDGRKVVLGGAMSLAGSQTRLWPGARFDVTFCDGCTAAQKSARDRGFLELFWLYTPNMGQADVFVNDVQVGKLSDRTRSTLTSDVQVLRIPVRGDAHTLSVQVREAFEDENIRQNKGPVHLFSVVQETTRRGVVVDAIGLPGSTGMTWQRWRQDILGEQIRARAYDLVVLGWGTNEASLSKLDAATYKHHLRNTTSTLLSSSPGAACLFMGPTESYRALRDKPGGGTKAKLKRANNLVMVQEVQASLAKEFGCALFDPLKVMGGKGGILAWEKAGLAKADHIHLTPIGYEKLADVLVKDLLSQLHYEDALREKRKEDIQKQEQRVMRGQKSVANALPQKSQKPQKSKRHSHSAKQPRDPAPKRTPDPSKKGSR